MNLPESFMERVRQRISRIYNDRITERHITRLFQAIEAAQKPQKQTIAKWSEKDAILITYGDSLRKSGEAPLKSLHQFLLKHLKNQLSCVHILPFFPYSSDDGFSVIDYMQVKPDLGDWADIAALGQDFDLMFDLVINHISQKSLWFEQYIKGTVPYDQFFIEADTNLDLSAVVRPRKSPLLTPVETAKGLRHVWTTFSADQIDLNFKSPDLFLEMMQVLINYVKHNARIIRLDAIAFLWKEIGTSCLHLPQTHEMVKLMRDICEQIDAGSIILTETNVPNLENLSYFGQDDEAHMVYQFSLPPLLLHALYKGDSSYLNQWAITIPDLPAGNTFFNFTASHDGIGVRPLEGLLPDHEKDQLIAAMKKLGGSISTKANSDGTESPYEMNITYFDACRAHHRVGDQHHLERFLCSQTVMMSMRGIPALYIHSLLATPNDLEGVARTGRARSINRHKWKVQDLEDLLNDQNSINYKVLNHLKYLLDIRQKQAAFHPDAAQEILDCGRSFFALRRETPLQILYAVCNLSAESKQLSADALGLDDSAQLKNLIDGNVSRSVLRLSPYECKWLLCS